MCLWCSRKRSLLCLNSDVIYPNKIKACRDESDNNCFYMSEVIIKPLSRINYYLAVTIARDSAKDLKVLYKYSEENDLPQSIYLSLSIFKDDIHETYHLKNTYNTNHITYLGYQSSF